MITAVVFMLFLGLIVFGPKKTVEIAQTIGRLLGQVKHATGQFQTQIEQEVYIQERNNVESVNKTATPSPDLDTFRPPNNLENMQIHSDLLPPIGATAATTVQESELLSGPYAEPQQAATSVLIHRSS